MKKTVLLKLLALVLCLCAMLCTFTACGEAESYIPHTHTVSDWIVDDAASCTAPGLQHKECTDCKVFMGVGIIDPVGHTFVDGLCSVCQTAETPTTPETPEDGEDVIDPETPEGGEENVEQPHTHTASDWIVDQDSTCTEIGLKHKICSECEVFMGAAFVEPKGHAYVGINCSPL